ncbi:MAG: pirin family protein, partial [Firmicutes bacterium]|nr:pirin family protein [Bacillota bacterium]
IHADVNVYAAIISAGRSLDFKLLPNRQAYLVLLEGDALVEDIAMTEKDALEIILQDVTITTKNSAHLYIIDMPYDSTP